MSGSVDGLSLRPTTRDAADVAALVHFSAYIAREAQRLGLPDTAAKARLLEADLLRRLEDD